MFFFIEKQAIIGLLLCALLFYQIYYLYVYFFNVSFLCVWCVHTSDLANTNSNKNNLRVTVKNPTYWMSCYTLEQYNGFLLPENLLVRFLLFFYSNEILQFTDRKRITYILNESINCTTSYFLRIYNNSNCMSHMLLPHLHIKSTCNNIMYS